MNPLGKQFSLRNIIPLTFLHFPARCKWLVNLMWSTCAVVDLLRDKKHSENALSAPVSPTINWTFVREDNSGRLRSLNSFPDGLTLPHIRLCCYLICRASSSLLANFLGQLLHVQGKGRSPVKKEDHQWIEIPRKFSLTIDIVSNFWGPYCLKKGASQPGLLFQLLLWLTNFK